MLSTMFGIEMEIPKGKLPGFYAQAVHKIGEEVDVYDRDKQLIVVSSETDRDKLAQVLRKYQMAGEEFTLWALPAETTMRLLEDYGFTGISGRSYVYQYLVDRFCFDESSGKQEDKAAALAQFCQHVLASFSEDLQTVYLIDSNHRMLLDNIASRFHVKLIWLDE